MSKPVKNLVVETYHRRFGQLSGAAVISMRGVSANDTTQIRTDLAAKGIKVTVVKNSLARRAFADTDLDQIGPILDGASAMVYPVSEASSIVGIARELMGWSKNIEALQFKGALMDGVIFGPEQLVELSKYPTREEAHAQAVQLVLSPGQQLSATIQGPGKMVASLVKAVREKVEKGEAVTTTQPVAPDQSGADS